MQNSLARVSLVVDIRGFAGPTLKSRVQREWGARIGLFVFLGALCAFVIAYSGFLILDVGSPILCVGLLYVLGLLETPFIPVAFTVGERHIAATLYNGMSRKLRVSGRLGGFSLLDLSRVKWRSPSKAVPAYLLYGSNWVKLPNDAYRVLMEELPRRGFTLIGPLAGPKLVGEDSPLFKGNAVRYGVRAVSNPSRA